MELGAKKRTKTATAAADFVHPLLWELIADMQNFSGSFLFSSSSRKIAATSVATAAASTRVLLPQIWQKAGKSTEAAFYASAPYEEEEEEDPYEEEVRLRLSHPRAVSLQCKQHTWSRMAGLLSGIFCKNPESSCNNLNMGFTLLDNEDNNKKTIRKLSRQSGNYSRILKLSE